MSERSKVQLGLGLGRINFQLIRHLFFYGLSVGMTSLVGFVLILIFVRIMTPADYAKIVLVKNTLLLIVGIGGLGLSQSVIRWMCDVSKEKVFTHDLYGILILFIPVSLIMLAVIYGLGRRIGISITWHSSLIIALVVLVELLCYEIINWSRAEHKSHIFAIQNLARGILQIVFVVSTVYFFRKPISYLIGFLLADICFLLFVIRGNIKKKYIVFEKIDFQMVFKMISYGWPNSMVVGGWVLLNAVDRYMLSFLSAKQSLVAYYDSAYVLSTAFIFLLSRAFNLYLFPTYMQNHNKFGDEFCAEFINRIMRIYLYIGFSVVALLVLFKLFLFHLLFPLQYTVASSVMMPVSLGVLYAGLMQSVASGLYINNKTYLIGVVTLIALAINVVANLFLIPRFGMDGAAYSTLIAFSIQIVLTYIISSRYLFVRLPWLILLFGTALIVVVNYYIKI